jgi:hypothetical protein
MATFMTLKARMISAHVLLIPKSGQDAEFMVATNASKVGILHEYYSKKTLKVILDHVLTRLESWKMLRPDTTHTIRMH